MLEVFIPSSRRHRHDGDGADPEATQRGGGFRSIGAIVAPIAARAGVQIPQPPPPPPLQPDPPPAAGLDHVAGAGVGTDA